MCRFIGESVFFIYKITNLVNGKIYVGQHKTHNIDDGYLGSGKLLFHAIKKYGKASFRRDIIEFCDKETVNDREVYWVSFLNSTDRGVGYNICNGGRTTSGYKHSQETKDKIGNKHRGKKCPPRPPMPDNTRLKISRANKGKVRSQEIRDIITEKLTGKKHSEATLLKMSKSQKGRKHSVETKQKISIGNNAFGRIYENRICNVCGKEGSGPNMTRYHFDNCKMR